MANTQEQTNPPTAVNTSVTSSDRTVTILDSRPQNMLQQAHHYVSIKLTATNYLFWRAQLVPFLRGQNRYGFVDGTTVCPPEFVASSSAVAPATNPSYAQWIQQDQSILSMIILSLAEEVLYLAIGHSTSRAVWLAVETALGSASRARSLSLLTQLQNLRQGDSTPVEYLGRAQVLVEQLAQAGRPIGLDEQNLHVFRGLRAEYRGLVASLTTKSAPLTIHEVSDFLSTHQYLFPDESHTMLPQSPSALIAQHPQSRPSHDGGRGRGRNHRRQ
ncbi:PREDICTED: uncharacterized protein LOC109168353 [Ipomoea nil]|uniref:uncharacterized protein LOC109168353 n=1 Tax=Ipomoea nil TaxID=35883 RepID=UPI000901F906|nr:PREDICTED: uncharacterized protein LOC109168353 [Ipomoea nil]